MMVPGELWSPERLLRQLSQDHERAVPTEQARFMMVPGRTVVSERLLRQLAVKDHERAVPTEQARFMMVPGRTVVGRLLRQLGVRRTESCLSQSERSQDGGSERQAEEHHSSPFQDGSERKRRRLQFALPGRRRNGKRRRPQFALPGRRSERQAEETTVRPFRTAERTTIEGDLTSPASGDLTICRSCDRTISRLSA